MKSSLIALQTIIYSRLASDTQLQAKNIKTYDYVPETASLPYIALGEDSVTDSSNKTNGVEDVTHTLHIWSDYKGKKEAKEIMGLVKECLTEPFQIGNGFFIVRSLCEFETVMVDPSGSYHGVMRFRFLIQQ